jgi:hypothetical protein
MDLGLKSREARDYFYVILKNFGLKFKKRLFGNSAIHIIGDSHSMSFKSGSFIIHHLGPATAFNLNKNSSSTHSKKKLVKILKSLDKTNEKIILIFGEIDCRIHIYNTFMKNEKKIPLNKIIARTIKNYEEVLDFINSKNINFYVCSIPPAGTQGNCFNYPFYADKPTRAKIHRHFNNLLEERCRTKGYKYINLYKKVSNRNGFAIKKYMADEIHLNEYAVQFLKEDLKRLDLANK